VVKRLVTLFVIWAAASFGFIVGLIVLGMLFTPPEHRPKHLRRQTTLERNRGLWRPSPHDWDDDEVDAGWASRRSVKG
jgi:hypothetical protein